MPALLLLFVGSGCAALIYEIVWFQLLQLIVGSSSISLGVVLGTFMGGMCLGSLFLSKFVSAKEHPLRVYAALEAAIGIFGILILYGLPWAGGLYTAVAVHGMAGLFLRAVFCAICLLPPTLLMGATLPAIARWVKATPNGVAWLGFFYGGNTAGAVLGCILAGFYLLSKHDVAYATFVAVLINLAVAGAGLLLSKATPHTPPVEDEEMAPALKIPKGTWPVYATIALSGMSALGAEVVWTRLLSLMIGATTYTFSLILAAFLAGLGIGSSAGSVVARQSPNPRAALGWCQFGIMLGLAWAAYALTRGLPYWPINPELSSAAKYTFQIDMVRCLWVVLPSAILWGASFPIALAAIAKTDQDPGKLVGSVYAANTVGAIFGSLVTALGLVAWIGTAGTQRFLIFVAALGALFALVPMTREEDNKVSMSPRGLALGALVLIVALALGSTVGNIPGLLAAYGRFMPLRMGNMNDVIYMGEGLQATVAVSKLPNGVLN